MRPRLPQKPEFLMLVIFAVMFAFAGISALADDPEPTIVEVRQSGAPFGPYTDWAEQTVPETENIHDATLIDGNRSAFRWVRYKSGPQACTLTAKQGTHGLEEIGGGRECNATANQGHCGYFEEGYSVYLASGKSCVGFQVPLCGGLCQ